MNQTFLHVQLFRLQAVAAFPDPPSVFLFYYVQLQNAVLKADLSVVTVFSGEVVVGDRNVSTRKNICIRFNQRH